MCFVWISEQTAIISLYSINWPIFITETEYVYCAVRAEFFNIIQINFGCISERHLVFTFPLVSRNTKRLQLPAVAAAPLRSISHEHATGSAQQRLAAVRLQPVSTTEPPRDLYRPFQIGHHPMSSCLFSNRYCAVTQRWENSHQSSSGLSVVTHKQ
jgi:hypothetical protein